jgi:hypothetical protein
MVVIITVAIVTMGDNGNSNCVGSGCDVDLQQQGVLIQEIGLFETDDKTY